MSEFDRRQVLAARRGDTVTLRLLRDPAAQAVAFDQHAPLLDRVLAAAASGVMRPPVVEATLRESPALRLAVLDLANAQAGDVTVGQLAGRDVITINVYVGADHQ